MNGDELPPTACPHCAVFGVHRLTDECAWSREAIKARGHQRGGVELMQLGAPTLAAQSDGGVASTTSSPATAIAGGTAVTRQCPAEIAAGGDSTVARVEGSAASAPAAPINDQPSPITPAARGIIQDGTCS